MEQLDLFGGPAPQLPPDLLDYRPGIFTPAEARFYLETFINTVPWEQRLVKMYDKQLLTPRLTAWFGNTDVDYTAKNKGLQPLPWTTELLGIKARIEPLAGIRFNSVLLNYYRDGNDSVAWHSDNDGIPGRNHIVASVSFGQVRRFDIRHKDDHQKKYAVDLESGSYLLMKDGLQEHWEHRIAKSTKPMQPRVNLTFRISREGT